jgi:beta-lactamase class A
MKFCGTVSSGRTEWLSFLSSSIRVKSVDKKIIKNILKGLLFLVIFFVGFIADRLLFVKDLPLESTKNEREINNNQQWSFINPLLDCGDIDNISNETINNTKQNIINFLDEEKVQGITKVSVYFRDLNNGPWFGINEKEEFNPGSLLKVPMMMRIFKDADNDPSILQQKILVKGQTDQLIQYYKPDFDLELDKSYTVADLVSYMILYSNNDATKVIEQFIGKDLLYKTYEELGVKIPVDGNYSISARNYGSFFRVLFNSTYLDTDYSEQALGLLSQTTFTKGLRAGVPLSIKIAHKFGERKVNSVTKQLHDCGVVYYPKRPYLLCVMTRGDDYDQLASLIAQVSNIVYNAVDKENQPTF